MNEFGTLKGKNREKVDLVAQEVDDFKGGKIISKKEKLVSYFVNCFFSSFKVSHFRFCLS